MASPTSQRADDISITSKKRDFLFLAYIFETLTDFGKLLDNGPKEFLSHDNEISVKSTGAIRYWNKAKFTQERP